MDYQAARKFYIDRVFASFRNLEAYLNGLDNKGDTTRRDSMFRIWAESLAEFELQDAESVLHDINVGRESVPDPWVFGSVFAGRCRVLLNRRMQNQRAKEALQAAGSKPMNLMGQIAGSELWQEYWLPISEAIKRGDMTREAGFREWNRILESKFSNSERVQGFI